MAAIKSVIVVGATGFLGKRVVEALAASGFSVSILSRDVKKSLPHAKTVVTDFSDASLRQALQGHEAVVSTMGAAGMAAQTKVIDAAVAVGVKRFIPSDYAPNSLDLTAIQKAVPQLMGRLQPRQDAIKYLKQQTERHPDFSWTAIGSCLMFEWAMEIGGHGMIIPQKSAVIVDSGDQPYITTTAAQIARAICHVLAHPQQTANRLLVVKSFTTSQNKMLALMEKITKTTWQVSHTTSEQHRQDGVRLLSEGNLAGGGKMWGVWHFTDGLAVLPPNDFFANTELDLPEEDIESVVRSLV